MTDEKKKVKFKDEKTRRWIIDDDLEFYMINDVEDSSFEVKASAKDVSVGGKRDISKKYHAFIVKDSEYGKIPYSVWEEKKRQVIAGTISPHMDSPITPDSISIASTVHAEYTIDVESCRSCSKGVPVGMVYCPHCGIKV